MAYQLTIYNYEEFFKTLPKWTTHTITLLLEKPFGLISVIANNI
jgi:hypothetical protein